MRTCQRNLQPFYYCLYQEAQDQTDEYGNILPEPLKVYGEPVLMYANISPATGQTMAEIFGNLENYDKVIVTTDMNCPIDENTVLFVDKIPENLPTETTQNDAGSGENTETEETNSEDSDDSENVEDSDDSEDSEEESVDPPYQPPQYDYIVKGISKSLNGISIAIRKVNIG